MTNQHPITPPPELVDQWWDEVKQNAKYDEPIGPLVTTKAARWGADQELEACCQALYSRYVNTGLVAATAATVSQEMRDWLRAARRPKPPSLKDQALEALGPEPRPETGPTGDTILNHGVIERHRLVRRALEALPE